MSSDIVVSHKMTLPCGIFSIWVCIHFMTFGQMQNVSPLGPNLVVQQCRTVAPEVTIPCGVTPELYSQVGMGRGKHSVSNNNNKKHMYLAWSHYTFFFDKLVCFLMDPDVSTKNILLSGSHVEV